jgi:heterodisulfide reductase subunit A
VGIFKSALVIGGGISGMVSSLSLARQGYDVYLVEREKELGGNLLNIKKDINGYNWQEYLARTIEEVRSDEKITTYLDSRIDEVNGFVGNFKSAIKGASLKENRQPEQIEHGVIIIATGAEDGNDSLSDYSLNDSVVTQSQLEEKLESDFPYTNIIMIQCVGSRNEKRPYCSRVCCQRAVKNSISIKEKNPDANVYVLYREIRTYGYNEIYYRKAREIGVVFIHFPDDKYPELSETSVKVYDTIIEEELTLKCDLAVLSTPIIPDVENNSKISEQLKVPLNEDSFFMEAHVKLRPVDFANEGIFVCGLAHSPKNTSENITQALAASSRAACILAKDSLDIGGAVSSVDEDKCAVCLTCVRECVYNAPFVNENGKAEIEGAKCQGCGNCAAACPAKAIQLKTFTDTQQIALVREILNEPVKDL